MTNEEARQDGIAARAAGKPLDSNPHAPATAVRAEWRKGWQEEDARQKAGS